MVERRMHRDAQSHQNQPNGQSSLGYTPRLWREGKDAARRQAAVQTHQQVWLYSGSLRLHCGNGGRWGNILQGLDHTTASSTLQLGPKLGKSQAPK